MALPLSYNFKNLLVCKVSTGFTVAGVGLVVFVFTALMGFVSGLKQTLEIAGDPRNVTVLKQGATAESNSAISPDEVVNLTSVKNYTAYAPEYLTIAGLPRVGDTSGNWANVPVRGVVAESVLVHDKVAVVEGEDWNTFVSGTGEYKVLVGKAAARQYARSNDPADIKRPLQIGDTIKLGFGGDNQFRIVGFFEAGGGVHESEIWAYGPHIKDVYKRAFYSSVTVKAQTPENVEDIIAYAEGPSVGLTAMSEAAYLERQTESTKPFLVLSYGLLFFMGIAAGFAVANNMYAMVAGRMREIAMLRAIGFPPHAVIVSFMIEALMLAGAGGLVGCLAALPLATVSQDMIGGGGSFTAIVFKFNISPTILAVSMTIALVLGFLGALFPALKAGRTPVVTALRQA
jgi:putative ABC transport system permease protein